MPPRLKVQRVLPGLQGPVKPQAAANLGRACGAALEGLGGSGGLDSPQPLNLPVSLPADGGQTVPPAGQTWRTS